MRLMRHFNIPGRWGVIFAGAMICSCGLFFIYGYSQDSKITGSECTSRQRTNWAALERSIQKKINLFHGDVGIVIEDLRSGLRMTFNENKLFPSASVVKVPIMAACFKADLKGEINLGEEVVLLEKFKAQGSGRLKCFRAGTRLTIQQLVELMVSASDNTACNMLIELLGFEYLNSSFKDFGLKDTNIVRKMMDFRKRANGRENFTTASDMANLFKSMYYGRLINRDISKRCLLVLKKQKVKDRIPRKLPKGTMVAHKTGLERKICHDAGIIFTHSGGYLIVVLTKHRYKNSFPVKKFISQIALELYSYAQKS